MVITSNKDLHIVRCGGMQFTHQGGKKEALALALKAVELRAVSNIDTSVEVSANVGNRRIKRIYWGYTRSAAINKFKADIL